MQKLEEKTTTSGVFWAPESFEFAYENFIIANKNC